MIPYIKVPDFHIGWLPLHPFGVLVATGVILGTMLAMGRGRQRGFDLEKLNSFITWMLAVAFFSGHVLDEILYHPDEVLRRPWSLLMLWEGLGSFPGFFGGVVGVLIWKYIEWDPVFTFGPLRIGSLVLVEPIALYRPHRRPTPLPIMPFCDLILSVYPVAWVFGRAGCSSVHDHPGAPTTSWLGVEYPGARAQVTDVSESQALHTHYGPITFIHGHYPRFDLGLLELMFTVILAFAFALTWHKKLRTGTYIAVTAFAYGPVRFAMDFLRIRDDEGADPRYGGLTPAQWGCVALVVLGIAIVAEMQKQKKRGVDPADALRAMPVAPSHPTEAASA
jgi:phosphatidylglycerol:prolipoprotein diacylglycerol transferase